MSDIERESDRQEDENLDDMAEHVMSCFHVAKQHRDGIGISDAITDSLRRYRGKYDCDEASKFEGIGVFRGVTGMLVRSLNSWLKDAYFSAEDRPWTLMPTPNPELPEFLSEELEILISSKIQEQLAQSGFGNVSSMTRDEITKLRNTASEMAMEYATESTEGMSRLIEDQMTEAKFKNTFQEFLLNLCIFPYAVLKGPVIKMETVPKWKNNRYKFVEEAKYSVENVEPINFYMSPDSKNVQDGEYCIEVCQFTRARLLKSKKLKGFSKEAINLVLAESSRNARRAELAHSDSILEDLDGVDRDETGLNNDQNFTVYVYYGRISGEYLLEYLDKEDKIQDTMEKFGDTISTDYGDIDPYDDYEAQIWVCNGVAIMARLVEPNPIPFRPYYVTSAYKVPGSPYGESLPGIVSDLQDELNTAARSRVYNMGMSSGAVVEVDVSRMPDNQAPAQIFPWMVIPVTSNSMGGNNTAPAVRFNPIPNVSAQLTQVMEEVWEKAHRVSGIPPYMYGDAKGSAPTLGAFSLQYAGATKGVKSIISNIDSDVVEKMVEQFYYYNMYFHDDESIKADAQVKVRGASGLIAQEQRQARPLELLQALGPILAQMQPETALALANETLKQSGYDPASLGAVKGNASAEAQNRMIGVDQPQPDGRSGNAQQLVSDQQIPPPVQ
jgi:hypothetical protein